MTAADESAEEAMFPFRDKRDDADDVLDVEVYVRHRAGHAGFAAGLLIFFGFFWFGGPTGTGLFHLGDSIFHYTLRLGGLAMVGIAIWSSIGMRSALVGDGVLSVLIGGLLAISAVLMTVAVGFGYNNVLFFIYFVCGVIVALNGLTTLREYLALTRLEVVVDVEDGQEAPAAEPAGSTAGGREPIQAEQLLNRSSAEPRRRKDVPPPSSTPGRIGRFSEEQRPRRP